MRNNLIAEMVKRGYKADQIPKIISKVLDCSERTVRNKINNVTDFTFTEVLKISDSIFNNELDVRYLFAKNKSEGAA